MFYEFHPPLSEATAQRARPIGSRGRNDHVRTQGISPRHKNRRAKDLEILAQQPFSHALPTADREYFNQVVTNLRNASHLALPQSLEPIDESSAGGLLIDPCRLTGPGAAAARESVYAVLVERCTYTSVRPDHAITHVRDHLKKPSPYLCLMHERQHHPCSGHLPHQFATSHNGPPTSSYEVPSKLSASDEFLAKLGVLGIVRPTKGCAAEMAAREAKAEPYGGKSKV